MWFIIDQVQTSHVGEEMLHRRGEAEGSHRGAPAERFSSFWHPGEDQVLPHSEKGPAVPRRLHQIFQGRSAPVSWLGRRRGAAVLLTKPSKTGFIPSAWWKVLLSFFFFLCRCWKSADFGEMHYLHFHKKTRKWLFWAF